MIAVCTIAACGASAPRIASAHFKALAPSSIASGYTVTFGATGTCAFERSIHPASMEGKVIVG